MDNGQFNTTEATLPTAVDERLWQRSPIHIALYVTKRPTGCRKSLQEAQRSRGACLLGNLYCFDSWGRSGTQMNFQAKAFNALHDGRGDNSAKGKTMEFQRSLA
ncbi:unnamed protein product [Fusarium graminearum]|nr:unnamed protein product [Fusarium graminearum]